MRNNNCLFVVLLSLLLVFTMAEQEVPLVKGQYGFSIGNV